jgi:hypothetical protein
MTRVGYAFDLTGWKGDDLKESVNNITPSSSVQAIKISLLIWEHSSMTPGITGLWIMAWSAEDALARTTLCFCIPGEVFAREIGDQIHHDLGTFSVQNPPTPLIRFCFNRFASSCLL